MRIAATCVALLLLALVPASADEPAPSPVDAPVLPAVETDASGSGLRMLVQGFRIEGSTVFDSERLREVVSPWMGREIDTEELVAVRNALTRLYVDAGYVNSGALVPDQDLEDGIVEIWIIEGTLSHVDVRGNRYYRAGVLSRRLSVGMKRPLQVHTIERNLQVLQQDPRIRRVHASLVPGEGTGEAVLVVRVEEESPWDLDFEISNYSPVAFGAYEGRAVVGHRNLLGLGDVLDGRVRVAAGLIRADLQYDIPINRWGTRIKLRGEYADTEVKEDPFDALEIDTNYWAGRVSVEHPVYRDERDTVVFGVVGEWRRAKTCFGFTEDIFGSCDPFNFLGSGAQGDGRTTVSMLRLTQDWTRRTGAQVIAARSTFGFGLPILGATSGGIVDDEFFVWLGQAQWARRFGSWGVQTILRGDAQLSNGPLPSLERIPIGGHATVRGYRENQLVRDQGAVLSAEVRVPVWRREGRPILEVAPFFDFGWSKNQDRPTPGPETISSVGVGVRWAVYRGLSANVYWGHQLQDVLTSGNLQDQGVQFRLHWDAF
jgi:hemolysin activation/secretion protein